MFLAFFEYVQIQGFPPIPELKIVSHRTYSGLFLYSPWLSMQLDRYRLTDFLKNEGMKYPKCIWPLKGLLKE